MSFILVIIFLFGLSIGSMLNAYIWRLSIDSSIWSGRSVCTSCRKTIAWYDLIPVVSYLLLRGKCRNCKKAISLQYPLVEIATAVLITAIFWQWMPHIPWYELTSTDTLLHYGALLIRNWYFLAILIILFFTDLKWMTIPDRVTIPAIVIAYMVNGLLFYKGGCMSSSCLLELSWTNYALAAIVGGGFFWLQYVISKGKWIGGGDIRFGLLLGAMFGFPGVVATLMMAYISGAIISAPLLAMEKKTMQSQVPFGTFLAAAGVVMLLFGDYIIGTASIFMAL